MQNRARNLAVEELFIELIAGWSLKIFGETRLEIPFLRAIRIKKLF